ncbi:MAG TPA: HEAT repeat domain-containing protein [Blastocatellia bacterium]|nr:HEAT repeat domain-containing protein [Blastocatellia bacterium]
MTNYTAIDNRTRRGASRAFATTFALVLLLTNALSAFAQTASSTPRPTQAPASSAGKPVTAATPAPRARAASAQGQPAPAPTPSPSPQAVVTEEDVAEAPEPPEEYDFDVDIPDVYVNVPELDLEMLDVPAVAPAVLVGPMPPMPPMPSMPSMPAMPPMAPMATPAPMEGFRVWNYNQDAAANEKDPARKAYLEGRELVNDAEWAKAADKFNVVLTTYSTSKIVDAALYWYAVSLKKQGKYKEADTNAGRLVTEFPKSRYVDEAKQLQLELAQYVGRPVDPAWQRERNDENKAIALQSLFASNPERAIPIAADLLAPGSTATPKLQQRAALLLGQVDDARATDVLIGVARSNSDPKVRRMAILGLGQKLDSTKDGDRIFTLLSEIARGGGDPELAKYAVSAIGHDDNARSTKFLVDVATTSKQADVRKIAISMLSGRSDAASFDALMRLVDTDPDPDIRRIALAMIAQNDNPKVTDKLVDIARGNGPVDLKRMALNLLAQRDPSRAVDTLSAWYDTEKNETLRGAIVDSLGQINDKRALQKLMQIAKNDPSNDIRRKAVFWIGQSKDPEAIKFLEDLLK